MIDQPVLRAVFDTNVIIAALKSRNPRSPTLELLKRWQNREFTLLYADDLLAEYREKFITRHIALPLRLAFLASINVFGERVALTADQIQPVVLADPDDDVVIACAIAGNATHLVTYDPHLLNLGAVFQGVTILDGLHFLYAVRGDQPPPRP
ncbi:MAG TPA: putative toxin-antitoxin system toxin component, PIN family [Chloroflexi bacterium]|nr:putative toxin-antitoxin system toxin component, PIN family [Chloroflexota bacterium]